MSSGNIMRVTHSSLERKRMRARESQKKYLRKKRLYIINLERKVLELEQKNKELLLEIESLSHSTVSCLRCPGCMSLWRQSHSDALLNIDIPND